MSHSQFKGKTIQELLQLFPKDSLKKITEKFTKRMKGSHTQPYEVELIDGAGEKRTVEINASPIKKDDQIVGDMAILRDITQHKRNEQKIREYSHHLEDIVEKRTKQLKEKERLSTIGETTTMVGHDLRNPLQAIVNNLYLARKKIQELTPQEKEVFKKNGIDHIHRTIEQQSQYMNKIVSDLQDYARPIQPEFKETNIHKLIEQVLESTEIPPNIETKIKTPPDLTKIQADPNTLRRAITNLVTNAIQAMPNGGQLTIKLENTENQANIKFRDTGTGINQEDTDKIFEPMYTTKAQGQGFGLPVCKRIIQAHKGKITYQNNEKQGTTFTITLPKKQ